MDNLLKKASILITPTAYDNGSINAIKPKQTFGNELVTNGDFSNGSTDWGIENSWTISNGLASGNGANGSGEELKQNSVLPIGKKYRLTYEIKNYVSGTVRGAIGANNSGNGIYTDFFKSNRTALAFLGNDFFGDITNISVKEVTNADLDFTRATSGSVVGTANRENADGVLEVIDADFPRIDYLGGVGHWLIEPQATNTATYSNDLSQGAIFSVSSAPSDVNATLTANEIASPDGTTNAMKLTCATDTNTIHQIRVENVVVFSDNTNIISLFVKKGSGVDFFAIAADDYDTTNSRAWFNVNTGVLGTQSNVADSTIEDYGDGWYRCSMAFKTTIDVIGTVRLIVANADNTTQFDGNGEFLYYYGLQCETSDNDNATKPTSYIPTSGITVTRAADSFGLNTTLDTSLIDSTEGTFYVEMAALANDRTNRLVSLSEGNDNNTIRFRFEDGGFNRIRLDVKTQSGQNSVYRTTSYDILNFSKIALRFKENDCACFVNGTEVIATVGGDTGATYSADTLTKIRSRRGDDALPFEGKIKCIAVFKEGLTDGELTCLTT